MKIGSGMFSGFQLYPEPPFRYENNHMATISFRTRAKVIRDLVPAPLVPNPYNLAFIYVGDLNIVAPQHIKYKEAGFGIPVTFQGKPGYYYVSVYLDSVAGVVGGREIWGWPKKDAEISYTADEESVQISVSRDGVALITASVHATRQVTPLTAQPDIPVFNLKVVPSVTEKRTPDVFQLTSVKPATKKKTLQRGSATLSFQSATNDQFGRIPIVEVLGGERFVEDLDLGYGEVLFDYLMENQKA